jgi:hypothetical protein
MRVRKQKMLALTTRRSPHTVSIEKSQKTKNWQLMVKKTVICLAVCIFIRNFAVDFE